jgi:hypothetical protein
MPPMDRARRLASVDGAFPQIPEMCFFFGGSLKGLKGSDISTVCARDGLNRQSLQTLQFGSFDAYAVEEHATGSGAPFLAKPLFQSLREAHLR